MLSGSVVKNPPANAGDLSSIPGSGRSPEEKWQPTPVFLPEKFHGQRSLASYSPYGHSESDTTEHACNVLFKFTKQRPTRGLSEFFFPLSFLSSFKSVSLARALCLVLLDSGNTDGPGQQVSAS